jgi:hypothetical protein
MRDCRLSGCVFNPSIGSYLDGTQVAENSEEALFFDINEGTV